MTNNLKINDAYKDMLQEEFVNAPGAPTGAMSSGPELNKLMRPSGPNDQKFSIYNLFKPNKKKQFENRKDAEKFMEENPNWTFELKESHDNLDYNTSIIKENNTELYDKWILLKEQYEAIHYETRKWLENYNKPSK